MANLIRRHEGGFQTPSLFDPVRAMRDLWNWDPFSEMSPFLGAEPQAPRTFVPSFEVKETKDAYVFKADLPGIDEKDLEITLTGNRLTVSGKREATKKEESETFFTYERSYGSFTRSFTLPEGVDPDHVEKAHG